MEKSNPKQSSKNLPDYIAYTVSEHNPDDKGFWNQIGAAWNHDDDAGFNVKLTALPIDGQIVFRKRKDKLDGK